MISPFLLSNQKIVAQLSQNRHQYDSVSISRIKDDQVKLLRERIMIMEKRVKQKQEELNILKEHMKSCSERNLKSVDRQAFGEFQDFLLQDVELSSSLKLKENENTQIQEKTTSNKNQTIKLTIIRQVQLSITSQNLQSHAETNKNSENKKLIHNLQAKLISYEKKHIILQQTLTQRIQDYEGQIQRMKEKLKEEKKINNELMEKIQQLEWDNVSLRQEIQENSIQREHIAQSYSPKVSLSIGMQTDQESCTHKKMTLARQIDVKITSPVINKDKKNMKVKMHGNVLNVKVSPNGASLYIHKKHNKLFIFSRQVHEKVFNTVNQPKKVFNYNYNLNEQNPIEIQNQNKTSILHQNRQKDSLQQDNKSRYRSMRNLKTNIQEYQSQDKYYKQNKKIGDKVQHYKLALHTSNQFPLPQIYNLYHQTDVSSINDFQRRSINKKQNNLSEVQKYKSVFIQQNYDGHNNQYASQHNYISQRINPSSIGLNNLTAIDSFKKPSFTIRQDLHSSNNRHQSTHKRQSPMQKQTESRRISQSVSVKDLIVQKCRANVLRS